MGKIGDYEYPELMFTEAVKMIKSFQDKLRGNASNVSSLANAMGHKSGTSGPFRTKTADLKKYGLLEGRGEFKTTDLAKQILFFHNRQEYQTSIKNILKNIPLFEKIYEIKKKDVQDSHDFRIILTDITHADRQIIQDKSERIRNIYIDLISNIDDGFESERSINPSSQKRNKEDIPNNMINANIGLVYIEMPREIKSIEIAKKMIDLMKEEIETDSKSNKKNLESNK